MPAFGNGRKQNQEFAALLRRTHDFLFEIVAVLDLLAIEEGFGAAGANLFFELAGHPDIG